VAREPTRRLPRRLDELERQRGEIEATDLRPLLPEVGIAQVADDDDLISDERRRVEVCRREDLARVAEDVDLSVGGKDVDVVVDVEVGVVPVLVLAADRDRAPVGENGLRLTEAVVAPRRLAAERRRSVVELVRVVGGDVRVAREPDPDGIREARRVGRPEARLAPLEVELARYFCWTINAFRGCRWRPSRTA
jgi:hypothetical protein